MPLILSSDPAAPPSCLSYLFLPTLVSLISFCKAARPRGSRRSGSRVGAPGGAGRRRGLAPASARVEAAVRPRRGSRRRTGLGPSPSVGVARPRARARPGSGVVAAHPRPAADRFPLPCDRIRLRPLEWKEGPAASAASTRALAPPPPAPVPARAGVVLTVRGSSGRRKCYFWRKWRARAGQALQQWPAYGARERGTAAAAAAGGRGACQWDW